MISASHAQVLKPRRSASDAGYVDASSNNRPATGGDHVAPSALDVHAAAALDRLTRWAATALRAPEALVSLVQGELLVVTSPSSGIADEERVAALCARVVATHAPIAVGGGSEPAAFLGAPLIDSSGNVLGCLCAVDRAPREWSAHDTALVEELAISATTELELRTARAMAERERRWSYGQQAVLELIAARAPLAETLTKLLRVAESHASGMLTSVLLLERDPTGREVLRHAAAPSLPRRFTSAVDGLEVGDGQGICGTAAFRGEPVVVLDVMTDPLTAQFVELAEANGLRAGWSTPILSSAGDVLGTFAIYYGPSRLPKPSDEIVIDRSIHLARLAIEQFHDARELRRSASEARALAREQTALQRVATSVAAETNPAILFARVAQQVGMLLGAESGYVVRFEGDEEFRTMGSWGRKGATLLPIGDVNVQAPDGLCADLRRGRSVRRRSVAPGSHLIAARHRIAAPIVVDGSTWGMVVALRDRPGAFPREDEKRIARFAQLASVAVANADAREHLATQALTDPLTELANRRAFDQRLAEETERALRHGRDLSLILVDVDHFKNINDRFGHATGDRVLVNLARNIEAVMRQGDLLARVGGDEMAMILGDCPPGQAAEVAHRMLTAIQNSSPLAQRHGVTLSIGVAGLDPDGSANELLRHADQALYRAKDDGRNRVVSYDERMAAGLTH
jgi:diguanylate cyclase (GGDEF)-like protein